MRRGFTLVELLVVIGIIGFLMLVSIPLFAQFSRGQQLDDAGRTIARVFNQARWDAVKKRERVRVVFAKDRLALYRESDGYGEEFEPVPLPDHCTYVVNFGEQKNLAPPDALPREDQITASQTGEGFPGFVEYQMDGTVRFGGTFQDQPQPKVKEVRLFDPNREVVGRVPRTAFCDIVVERRGETKRCYVDIDPNSGRVYYRILEGAWTDEHEKEGQ